MDTPETPDSGQRWRPRLSTRTVLTAAITIIDRSGATHLTMRGLGSVLGVQAMSLYRYFPNREALVEAVAAIVTDELAEAVTGHQKTNGDWQKHIEAIAYVTRQLALTHPWLFTLVATQPAAAPGLRPPIRSPRWAEQFLHDLEDGGFGSAAARAAYSQVTTFLLGRLLPEATALTTGTPNSVAAQTRSPTLAPGRAGQQVDPSPWPRVSALAAPLPADTAAAAFNRDLSLLVRQLRRERHP